MCSALEVYFTARDIFDLYRAIVPVHYARELGQDLARSMIYSNDCDYICHHLLTLGYQFQGVLPENTKALASFLDMIHLFRQERERVYLKQMACALGLI